ncbi:MAG: YncE family protein [Verrucomicrobiota bacterium]
MSLLPSRLRPLLPSDLSVLSALSVLFFLSASTPVTAAPPPWQHFEGRQTHPVALTPDGTRLLSVNTPDGRLSVFDISNPARSAPLLIAEIPVGMEPVSVRAFSNDEVWVVNEVSDSVSVISLPRRTVVATLPADDEPADVLFAGGKAFVTCARNSKIRVFDAASRTETAIIPLEGLYPRALTVNAAGDRVYAACLLSGNNTTVLPADQAPAPPAPTNPALPPAPKTALIVPASDSRIPYQVLDHDLAEISVADNRVLRWFSGVGTHLFDVVMHPVTGEIWVPNSESLNLIRFEPALRGHFIDHRVSRIDPASGAVKIQDLNPGTDYATLPNPASLETALAQPTALVFQPDGSAAWVAAYNSDRVAKLDAEGRVLTRVDLRLPLPAGSTAPNDSRFMRGPRGLAINAAGTRLYVLNKLANTVSVIDTASAAVLSEVPAGSHDPTPPDLKAGRAFLHDARLSGNGTASCASCHLDSDTDGLAWDLGDPGGQMATVIGYNNSVHNATPQNRVMHPMKGPLLTQTLRGLSSNQLLHWRGDRPTVASFNVTFPALLAGSELPAAGMESMAAYLNSLKLHPNPHRLPDRTLPAELDGGSAVRGRLVFLNHDLSHCITCHATSPTNPGIGSDNNVDLMQEVGSTQPVKTPHLRLAHQHTPFSRAAGAVNISGYGILKDGTAPTSDMPIGHPYALANLATLQQFNDLRAFILAFDTGTAPAVGRSRTVTAPPAAGSPAEADIALLETRANAADCDLTVQGVTGGRLRSFVWDKGTARYLPDRAGEPSLTRALLLESLGEGGALTFSGTLPGFGQTRTLDRDGNGVPDSDEPPPAFSITLTPEGPRLSWSENPAGWYPETATLPGASVWVPLTSPAAAADGFWSTGPPAGHGALFRFRRAW